jgi:hypothetical protein
LTREPFQLTGHVAQTYDSIRHNFFESFLFEPALDAGLSPEVLSELRTANVRTIRVDYGDFWPSEIWLEGWDGAVRRAR